jgi:hypothetical protein
MTLRDDELAEALRDEHLVDEAKAPSDQPGGVPPATLEQVVIAVNYLLKGQGFRDVAHLIEVKTAVVAEIARLETAPSPPQTEVERERARAEGRMGGEGNLTVEELDAAEAAEHQDYVERKSEPLTSPASTGVGTPYVNPFDADVVDPDSPRSVTPTQSEAKRRAVQAAPKPTPGGAKKK